MRSVLVVLSIACVGLCTQFAGAAPMDAVPFARIAGAGVVVPVTIDGAGPYLFLLDTGSSRSAVTETLAQSLGMRAVAKTAVVTSAGVARRAVVRLSRVGVGRARVDELMASVLSPERIESGGRRVDGLLGQDFLSGFNYTLDYLARRLVWDGAESPNATRLALRRSEGRFLVELPQCGGGAETIRLVPDSAADGLVLFERAGGVALPTRVSSDTGAITTVTGTRAGRSVRVNALRIGSITWRNRGALVVDRSGPDAPEGDGLLPLHTFGRVSFNNAYGYIAIEPW